MPNRAESAKNGSIAPNRHGFRRRAENHTHPRPPAKPIIENLVSLQVTLLGIATPW
jgi:hypothetical protein